MLRRRHVIKSQRVAPAVPKPSIDHTPYPLKRTRISSPSPSPPSHVSKGVHFAPPSPSFATPLRKRLTRSASITRTSIGVTPDGNHMPVPPKQTPEKRIS